MKKKIIITALVFPLILACAKKASPSPQEPDTLRGIETTRLKDFNNQPDIGYYNHIENYIAGAFTGETETEFPNGKFENWEDHCWMWGKYLTGPNAPLLTSSKAEFMTLFGLTSINCDDDEDIKKLTKTKDREFLVPVKGVRLVPTHFLSARYAQMFLTRKPANGYYFNGAALQFGTQEFKEDGGMLKKINGGGIVLKNIKPEPLGIVVVNGQITTGVPRALKSGVAYGFVQTVYDLAEKKMGNMPFTARPNKLKAKIKYTPKTIGTTTDKATIEIMLHGAENGVQLPYKTKASGDQQLVGPNALGYVRLVIDKEVKDWTTLEVPIFYKNTTQKPAYLLVNISAGFEYDSVKDSELFIESLEFIYE